VHLYGSTHSGHSFKVRSFLLLSSTAHVYTWIDLAIPRSMRPADFTKASCFGEVPVLVDQGRALCQSNAILIHLAQSTQTFGGGSPQWLSCLEWLFWESNRIGFSMPNLRFALLWSPQPPEVLHYLRQRVVADLRALDQALSGTDFLTPGGPSIADISCSAYLFWLADVGISESEFPHVQRWLCRIRSLPAWRHPDDAMQAQERSLEYDENL
jgi:glutathione S-transferase